MTTCFALLITFLKVFWSQHMFRYVAYLESNASAQVFHASSTCLNLFNWSLHFSFPYGMVGKYSALHCIQFKIDDSFSIMLKHITQWAVIEFWTHKNETPIKIHWQLLVFYGEDTVDISTVHHWVRKSWDSGGNLELNYQPCSGRSVGATHNFNRQNLFTKIKVFSESHSRKVKNWFSYGQGYYCRSGLQKRCVLNGCHVSLCPKWR